MRSGLTLRERRRSRSAAGRETAARAFSARRFPRFAGRRVIYCLRVSDAPGGDERSEVSPVAQRHARLGLWALAVFVALGVVLEALHGFKVGWYLDVTSGTRRLLLRLAHAHGTLLALWNVVYALLLRAELVRARALTSACFALALVLVPGGFLAGGATAGPADPGLGIVLVPLGALLLLVGTVRAALSVTADH